MDVFTTVLTRVVPVPIKPERLRVKALAKEPSTNKLTDDADHLENHEHYVKLSKEQSEQKQNSHEESTHQQQQEVNDPSVVTEDDNIVESIEDTSIVITHREEFIHPKKPQENSEENIKHLDLFV